MSCPGCGGPKSRRAKLCASCRRRANAVGERVWTESAIPPAPATPRTPQQSKIFYGKCAAIARAQADDPNDRAECDRRVRQVKRAALRTASVTFGRPIESSTALTEIEMEYVLEQLDEHLDRLDAAPA